MKTPSELFLRLCLAMSVLLVFMFVAQCLLGQQPTCGVERWKIKTMVDRERRAVDVDPIPMTIDSLRRLIPAVDPRHATGRIGPTEYHVYMVRAEILGMKLELDGDVHLVIAAPGDTTKTMIAEIPNIACAATDMPRVYAGMLNARAAAITHLGKPTSTFKRFPTHPVAIVTGVGFFDFPHSQVGLAPNSVEIHPVLALTFEH